MDRRHSVSIFFLFIALILAACAPGIAPTPTPTRTPRPTYTPTGAGTPTPDPNKCPLTAEHLEDAALGQRRPLIIKIGNDSRSWPQSGIHKADVVVEHLAEGGITRLDAVFLCQDSEAIGPVRSARLIDIWLTYMFDGILAHVGASGGVNWILVNETSFPRLDDWRGDPGFYLAEGRVRPYSTFTSTARLWEIAEARGWQKPMQAPPLLFGNLDLEIVTERRASFTIPYFSINIVRWEWDLERGKWLRFINGIPQTEAITGEQLSATNVVVIWAKHETTDIIEDENNQLSLEIKPWGRGEAVLLRDNYLIRGQWVWDGPGTRFSLFDEAGNPLPLAVGNTWIQVVPLSLDISSH